MTYYVEQELDTTKDAEPKAIIIDPDRVRRLVVPASGPGLTIPIPFTPRRGNYILTST